MNGPRFSHGVWCAATLAFLVSVMIAAFTPFVGLLSVVRFAIPLTALLYVIFLFRQSEEKTGRIVMLVTWFLFAATTWWLAPSLAIYLIAHIFAVWLIRSLYFYTGFLPATLDLGLSLVSLSAFAWGLERTGSVFLAVWCLFLVQALFVLIPRSVSSRRNKVKFESGSDAFVRARQQADKALQQIFTQ